MLGNLKGLNVETLCRNGIFLNDIDDSKMFKRICMMTQEMGIQNTKENNTKIYSESDSKTLRSKIKYAFDRTEFESGNIVIDSNRFGN